MTSVSRNRAVRTVTLIALAAVSAVTLAACNGKVRPTGVLPREYVPPPPAERSVGIKPRQGELGETPAPQPGAQPQRGLSVPSR